MSLFVAQSARLSVTKMPTIVPFCLTSATKMSKNLYNMSDDERKAAYYGYIIPIFIEIKLMQYLSSSE